MSKMVTIGISDLNVVTEPDKLITYALGSCVGICLYDPGKKIAGMSHIMLPSSELSPGGDQPYRYADTAIVALLRLMEQHGAQRAAIRAKIAGGAQMFASAGNTAISTIGQRNVLAVRGILTGMGIPIVADDTGADFGRTVMFDADTGTMLVKSATKGEWQL